MQKLSIYLTLAIASAPCLISAREVSVASPDGKTVVTTNINSDGTPTYSITLSGQPMLLDAPLGFKTNEGDFSRNLTVRNTATGSVSKAYDQDRIKKSHIDYNANTLTVDYSDAQDAKKHRFSIEWQVSDNNVGFRYVIPRQGNTGSLVITDEMTGYRFPDGTTTFITPQSDPMIGWKRTKPSYEEYYSCDWPMDTVSQYGHGYTFPALFHVAGNSWALLTETGVDGYYCGSHLSDYDRATGLYTIAYPMPGENNGNGTASPGIALPGKTPWRTITIGNTLAPIAETTIPWDLVDPLYETAHKARPGRSTWSWIIWQDNSMNMADQKTFVDLAEALGYENILIDAGWYKNLGRKGTEELIAYAHAHNVNPMLWYSSSGHWNDIVQDPTNLMDRPIVRKAEMQWLRDNGVRGIKVDFFGGDKQETIRLYEDILSDAADYGIDVIFHGCTMPRGWERMYPNYVGSEAVLASENLVFGQDFCNKAAFHSTLHPVIRNAAGIMEYGGTVLNQYLNRKNQSGVKRMTGIGFELATAILFHNPVQNFALTPNNLTDAPTDAIQFMKDVPTTWDDTRFIDGYPGRYVVLARRHGTTWYIAATNAEAKPMELKLDLSRLGISAGAEGSVLYDKDGLQFDSKALKVKKPDQTKITIQPNGGAVIMLPAN